MISKFGYYIYIGLGVLLISLGIAGCHRAASPSAIEPEPAASLPPTTLTATFLTDTPTPLPPTLTPVPLAARVNGAPLTLAEFEAELARYLGATGTDLASDPGMAQKIVLDDLIDQLLLAQAANEQGFQVDQLMLQTRIDQLTTQLGGAQFLTDWIAAHGYTQENFQSSLARQIEAAWMRDQIMMTVPDAVEQIHARQILLYNLEDANQVLVQIQSGSDFASLAAQYDPTTGGDLDWFPRGYLIEPVLDDAIFSLQPNEYTPVVATSLGFHIVQVIERDPQRPLTPDSRWHLQLQALQNWLQQRRSQSQIEVLLP